jgi:opacity protein-like surface antigen
MKKLVLFTLLALSAISSNLFAQDLIQEVSPIDKVQFWDVNNNYYVVLPYRINYSPMSPELSSSGTYSGGKAQSKKMVDGDFEKLTKAIKKIYDKEHIRAEKRTKGTVKIQLEHESGLVEFILIKKGKDSEKLEKMIKKRMK